MDLLLVIFSSFKNCLIKLAIRMDFHKINGKKRNQMMMSVETRN